MKRTTLATLLLTILLACGSSGWAALLRGALTASPAFLTSLNLGDKQQAVSRDFIDLGNATVTLADDLKACAKDKGCSLEAVNGFQTRFWDVLRHGNFKLSDKLGRIQAIVQGIIDSAKVYFGAARVTTASGTAATVTEDTLKAQIEKLKAEMKP